jgi:putative copper resistance protein D
MDLAVIAFRWTLYLVLGLVFGLPLFSLYAPENDRDVPSRPRRDWPLALLALAAIFVSVIAFTVQVAAMSGSPWLPIDRETVGAILTQTALGTALSVRLGALLVVALCCSTLKSRSRVARGTATLAGAVALTTLAWSGHGAADEGTSGWVHLISDILHLLAAGAWIGAIAAFIAVVCRRSELEKFSRLRWFTNALIRFGTVGAVTVALLIATGAINMMFLIDFRKFLSEAPTLYLYLLAAKLTAFCGMLVLAALHKFRLVPALEGAIAQDAGSDVTRNLRRSLLFEMTLALVVLGLIAWLGTLPPPASM